VIERLLAAERALGSDDLELAHRLFEQVADADARNAIAVVGLGEVAERRGQREKARELGERALEIDPDDAAAQRLLARLDAARVEVPAPADPAAPVEAPSRNSIVGWLRRLFRRGS
jgi:tetratricopeptide (TPR) repeat protein